MRPSVFVRGSLYFCAIMKRILFFIALSVSFAMAQETVESVRKQISAVEKETKREKSLHEAEKKRHEEFIAAGKQKVIALNAQNKSLRAELDSMKAEIAKLTAARNKASSTVRWYESKKAKYREELSKFIETLIPLVEADFPYRNSEAASGLKEIAEQLSKAVISPDDALGRALEIFSERIRLGYTTEVWKGVLTYEQREINGTFMRYGAVASLFVSTDGNEVFWLSESPEKGYAWENVSNNMEMRALLKEVLKVAEGKTAPRLVLIPVSLPKEVK